uniref:Proteasome subunit beta n=1 Tax=Rhabditophanes sp. KR3021 TaxID=114890 RepID=A0AC35TS70_9BILA
MNNQMQASLSIPSLGHFPYQDEITTGTTLIAVEYKDGVIVGTDSRTSSGSFIASRATDKITPISKQVVACRCGSAADTQAVADMVKYTLDVHELTNEEVTTVSFAANEFRKILFNNRGTLSAALIIAGYDKQLGGQVYAIPSGGVLTRQAVTALGSGATYVHTYLDSNWRPNLTREQCIWLVRSAVYLATSRDGCSGGVIRIAAIDESGTERFLYRPDIGKFPDLARPQSYLGILEGFKGHELKEELIM